MSEKSKTIAMSPVKSGQIAEIGHDGDTLAVRFKHGSLDKCVIYADIDAEKSGCKLVAVMNDNGADDAKWRDHRCTFEPCQKVGAGTTADQCPAPSCDECHERGDCTAEENAREAAEGHNA